MLKALSLTGYVICTAAVAVLLVLALIGRETTGWLMMCTLPTLLTTFGVCKVWSINPLEKPRERIQRWLIAAPLAVCAVFLLFLLLSIVLMAIALFGVTLLKLFRGGFSHALLDNARI